MKARCKKLTESDIIEAVGTTDLENLIEIEVLFIECHDIDTLAFKKCQKLVRLSMINNSLKCISSTLHHIRHSLLHLCLCNQAISRIENFDLPLLITLYLHNNIINKIENLKKLPNLQILNLSYNSISKIENIQYCIHLKELYLHSNYITSLSGLEYNVNLIKLGISNNIISSYNEIDKLKSLPFTPTFLPTSSSTSSNNRTTHLALSFLTDLSLYDVHYGKNPICDDEGYHQYIILNIRQIKVLDGVVITDTRIRQVITL